MKTDVRVLLFLAQFFLETENFRTNIVEKMKTRIVCSVSFFENRTAYEIMWENIVEPDRPQMKMWRLRVVCWIPKATNTHPQYAILIAFPLQQRLHERVSMLRHMYIASLVT